MAISIFFSWIVKKEWNRALKQQFGEGGAGEEKFIY